MQAGALEWASALGFRRPLGQIAIALQSCVDLHGVIGIWHVRNIGAQAREIGLGCIIGGLIAHALKLRHEDRRFGLIPLDPVRLLAFEILRPLQSLRRITLRHGSHDLPLSLGSCGHPAAEHLGQPVPSRGFALTVLAALGSLFALGLDRLSLREVGQQVLWGHRHQKASPASPASVLAVWL